MGPYSAARPQYLFIPFYLLLMGTKVKPNKKRYRAFEYQTDILKLSLTSDGYSPKIRNLQQQ